MRGEEAVVKTKMECLLHRGLADGRNKIAPRMLLYSPISSRAVCSTENECGGRVG